MGIPFYFKNLCTRFPNIISSPLKSPVERLFLDYNCVLHQSANKINTSLIGLDQNTLEDTIIYDALEFINHLIDTVAPKNLVYIAVDGLCPRAKLVQQRKRRFVTSWKNRQLEKVAENNSSWDSNCITPGTKFMKKFNKQLNAYKANLEATYPTLTFIISDSNQVGEGEHKIFKYIRENTYDITQDMIYGLDADLIMLSLIMESDVNYKNYNIYLLREKPVFDIKVNINSEFLTLNIQLLSNAVYKHYIVAESLISKSVFIKDYVILCTLLGNDFIPPLSYLKIKHDGIDDVIGHYLEINKEIYHPLITLYYSLNNKNFTQIIQHISQVEDKNMIEANENYYKRVLNPRRFNTRYEKLSSDLDNYPTLHKFPPHIEPQKQGWRMNYYHYLFGDSAPKKIHNISESYIQGVEWILKYYLTDFADFSWYYPYEYSPSILDLTNFMMSYKKHDNVNQKMHQAYLKMMQTEDFQLLMVLPPHSFNLLSKSARDFVESAKSGCIHYYPNEFVITTFLKYYLWECAPILPPIDIEYLYERYSMQSSRL